MAYPEREDKITELVEEHKLLDDGRLLLAIYYYSEAHPIDECLFEVIDNFGFNEISEDRKIMQIAFGSSSDFPLPVDVKLRMWLTSVPELQRGVVEQWPDVVDIGRAINAGKFTFKVPLNSESLPVWNILNHTGALV